MYEGIEAGQMKILFKPILKKVPRQLRDGKDDAGIKFQATVADLGRYAKASTRPSSNSISDWLLPASRWPPNVRDVRDQSLLFSAGE